MVQRLQLDFQPNGRGQRQTFDVPDIATALVVADINLQDGRAQIRQGERLVATLEKQCSRRGSAYWHVS